ncbi:SURF1 family protein [Sporichthya polymorpha]|uniref:SURF1 family cytochrome oxidase biogenesis protein n=1 Tax=Sporichthya polymorpha TaxID=35751 RepID=UPI000382608C|nr:SURF1 family protein [Sporichthya polymorpha]
MSRTGYRFLLTPRWIALALVAALTVPGCLFLAGWQFGRLHDAEQQNSLVQDNAEAAPVPFGEISPVGSGVRAEDEYRAVTVTGRYDVEHQLYVRNRPRNGQQGFHVLTPVVTAAGPAVLVDRGWIPAPVNGEPTPPETPTGTVTVTGYLRPSESPKPADDLPEAQVLRIDTAGIAAALPYPVHGGYLQLATQKPPVPIIANRYSPDPGELPGTSSELLHRSYGWQWYVFAMIGPIGFVLLARREAADLRADSARQERGQHV